MTNELQMRILTDYINELAKAVGPITGLTKKDTPDNRRRAGIAIATMRRALDDLDRDNRLHADDYAPALTSSDGVYMAPLS